MPTYIEIAKAALRDLGSIKAAAYYCERIAAQERLARLQRSYDWAPVIHA